MTALAQGLFDGQIASHQLFLGGVFTPHLATLVKPSNRSNPLSKTICAETIPFPRPYYKIPHTHDRRMTLSNTPCWEATTFFFHIQNQTEEWKLFYTRSVDFLKALDINLEEEDQNKSTWCQIKMMFEGDNRQALQTLCDNNNITAETQCTPIQSLNVIQTVIKEDLHFYFIEIKFYVSSASNLMKVYMLLTQ